MSIQTDISYLDEYDTIKDILGIPVHIGDTILGISGHNRFIEVVNKIHSNSLLSESENVYFVQNFIKIDDIINNNKEYFV